MTSIDLVEHSPAQSVRLDDATGRALAASGVVDAVPDPQASGRWRIAAAGTVGVASVYTPGGEAVTVRIAPKVPISRLLFLLGYSRTPKGWRSENVRVDEEKDLLPALARLFAAQAEHAVRPGLLQGYVEVEESALVIRGRVRNAEQIRRHHGRMVPLEIAHDEYTTDIAENRLVRTAVETLLRLGGVPGDVRTRLLRLRVALADVTAIPRGHVLPVWHPSRLNVRYEHALHLADLILRNASVEHRPGDVTVNGFLFDMARVFEDFVTVALRHVLDEEDGHSVLQARHHLDDRHAIRIVPDFVHYAGDGTPRAVVDAKYKAENPQGYPFADLYQMLAYCTALNLRDGHLVYAKGNAPQASHRITHTDITIHQHALDLDQSPPGVLDEVRRLAELLTDP